MPFCEYSLASRLPVTFPGNYCEGRTPYVTDSASVFQACNPFGWYG